MYNIANGGLIQKFSQTGVVVQRRVPKDAAFAEEDNSVVGGSNHGQIYIWSRSTGALLQQIKHPDGGMVQAVTVSWIYLMICSFYKSCRPLRTTEATTWLVHPLERIKLSQSTYGEKNST